MSGTSSGKPRRTCSNSVLSAIVCGSELQRTRIGTVDVQMRNDAQRIADCQPMLGVSADYYSLGARLSLYQGSKRVVRDAKLVLCSEVSSLFWREEEGIKDRDSSTEGIGPLTTHSAPSCLVDDYSSALQKAGFSSSPIGDWSANFRTRLGPVAEEHGALLQQVGDGVVRNVA